MMTASFAKRIFVVFIGCLAAVLAAALTASLLRYFMIFDANRSTLTLANVIDLVSGMIAYTIFVGIFIIALVLPVWAIIAGIAEWKNIRTLRNYLLAGVLSIMPYLLIQTSSHRQDLIEFWFATITAGFVSGLVYWAIAGRFSGDWRSSR